MLVQECWFRNVGSGRLVQEGWFRKVGSEMLVQECWFRKVGSRMNEGWLSCGYGRKIEADAAGVERMMGY